MNESTHPAATPGHEEIAHVMPPYVLVGVFIALIVLTVVTVAATWIDLGELNLWLAMGIASVKAVLVALYFMHLRYDNPVNALLFVGALVFVALFLTLTLMDTMEYQPEIQSRQEAESSVL
jgi:cytochrome c oxidase subunit 4